MRLRGYLSIVAKSIFWNPDKSELKLHLYHLSVILYLANYFSRPLFIYEMEIIIDFTCQGGNMRREMIMYVVCLAKCLAYNKCSIKDSNNCYFFKSFLFYNMYQKSKWVVGAYLAIVAHPESIQTNSYWVKRERADTWTDLPNVPHSLAGVSAQVS